VRIAPQDETECYIRNCAKYGMRVDPSVVITLRTRWSVMQPTKGFCEGCLLPLANILDHNAYIKCAVPQARGCFCRALSFSKLCLHHIVGG
jgi:hypothetical protein